MAEKSRKVHTVATPPPALLSFAAIQDPELSARACKILWALCYWAWGKKPDCWPSNEQIGELVHYSARTIQLGIRELATRGYIYRKMVKNKHGWSRVITLAERYRPELAMVEPTTEGSANLCATPSAKDVDTPTKGFAPPLAQDPSHQMFEDSEERKKELPPPSSQVQAGTSSGGPAKPGNQKEAEEPAWLAVDNLTDAQIAEWRATAATNTPMARIARRIIERWESKNTTADGPSGKDPRRPSFENSNLTGKFYQKPSVESTLADEIEHKTH